MELKTCRWRAHFEGDPEVYREAEEIEEVRKRDCIRLFSEQLLGQGITTEDDLKTLRDQAHKGVQEAIEFTDKSDYPPMEEIFTDLLYEERRAV